MQLSQGQIIFVHEMGGPGGNWKYQQGVVEILSDFDSRDQAEAFVKANVYNPEGQSIECQFILWLEDRALLKRFTSPPDNNWNVTNTIQSIQRHRA